MFPSIVSKCMTKLDLVDYNMSNRVQQDNFTISCI